MHRHTRLVTAAAVGAMAGACAGIELAVRFRQPDTRVMYALFAVVFALLGAAIGAIFQMAIAPASEPLEVQREDGE
jgi:hypothetical protein